MGGKDTRGPGFGCAGGKRQVPPAVRRVAASASYGGTCVDRFAIGPYRPRVMSIAERWRGAAPLPRAIAERVRELPELFRVRGVRLAYLFGSALREPAPDDVDLAVLMREGSALDLYPDLVRALGTDRLDLVDLATAPPLLRFQVVRDGVVLFREGEEVENEFELAAIREYRDTRHHRAIQDAYLRERARG